MKEVIEILITVYSEALVTIEPMNFEKARLFLIDRRLDMGTCLYVQCNFSKKVYDEYSSLAFRYTGDSFYWCGVPFFASSKKQIVETIQFRIDKLKQILLEIC